MNVLQYAYMTELLQLVLALTGLGLSLWGVWVAFEDATELSDAMPGDLRRLVAIGNMRAQLSRVSVQGVLVLVGMVSVLLPPPSLIDTDTVSELEQALLVRIGLVLVTVILTLDSFLERRHRQYFMSHVSTKRDQVIVVREE